MAPEHHQQQQKPGKRKRDNDNDIGSISRNSSNDNDDRNITATTSTNNNKPTASNSATNDDEKINEMAFIRVVDRRREQVTKLEPALVRALLLEIRSLTGLHFEILSLSNAIDTEKAGDNIKELLMKQYRIMTDVDAPSNRRRRSWDVVNEIFRLIDTIGGSATDENNDQQRKKVKYTGKIITSASITAYTSNATTQSTADTTAATTNTADTNPTNKNSGIVTTSASHAEASRPQVLISNRGNNNTTTSVNDITNSVTQNHPSMTENKTRNSENNETNKSNSSTNNRKNSIRTIASLSAASASTTAVAISSNSTAAVHPSMVGKISTPSVTVNVNNGIATPIGVIPPPYQERSHTVLDHRIDSQNRNKSGKNENRKHPPMNRSGSVSARNGESNKIPVHPAMRHKAHSAKPAQTTTATNNTNSNITTTTGSSFNNVRSTTAKTIREVSTSTALRTSLNAVSASSSLLSSSTSSLRQGMVTKTTAIPETVLSNKINTTTGTKSVSPQKLKFEAAVITVELPADNIRNNSYAGYVDSRPSIKLGFRQCLPTANMRNDLGNRLLKWDPYWKVEEMLCMGLTAPVRKRTYERNEDIPSEDEIATPNTAASFKIDQLLRKVGPKLRQINQGQSPRDCEFRVLVRMIPLTLTNEQSEKRADVHIWPKGTYFQVHAAPSNGSKPMAQRLQQRKQQSHNLTKWLGICHFLDLTSLLHNSWSSSTTSLNSFPYSVFEFGCHDSELYMFSLALCKYQSPQTLAKSLMDKNNKTLKRLTLEESYDRAINMMKDNEVTLDDSDDEGNNNDKDHQKKSSRNEDLKRIHFSLKDKVSLKIIKTPVRGRKCCHFSCFDLGYYLEMNKGASGQRWKCCLCENFLSYEDLELCALSEFGLKKFEGKLTADQHMVEFREDKSLELMKPARSRQERTQAKKSVNQASSGTVNETVDLLSDSD